MNKLLINIKRTKNPNDFISQEAVDIDFYNINNDKIGTASISAIDTNNAFLYNVEVYKKFRGIGYGKLIVQYCLDNYQIKQLTVEYNNTIAINLYKKFGFKEIRNWEENGKKLIVMILN